MPVRYVYIIHLLDFISTFYCFRKRRSSFKFLEFHCQLPPDVFCHDWYLLDFGPLLEILFLWKLHQSKVFWRDLKTNWIFIYWTCLQYNFPTRIFEGNDASVNIPSKFITILFLQFSVGTPLEIFDKLKIS